MNRGRTTFICLMLAPAVLLYGGLVLWPMLQAFYLSLFNWSGLSDIRTFVGFQNYRLLLSEQPPHFKRFLGHNLQFLIVTVAVVLPLALFFAANLTRRTKGSSFYRAVYLFPNVISVVAVASLWFFIYDRDLGLLNAFLELIGLSGLARTWLGDPSTALYAIIATSIWAGLGFYILLFNAGVQNIPEYFNEAAELDGATGLQRFRHVTLPLIWEVFKLGFLYLVIHCINLFGLVYVLNLNQPNSDTDVILTYLYQKAFAESDFGYAAAIAAVGFVIILITVLLSLRLLKRETVEF